MAKYRYVLEIDTSRVPHEYTEDKKFVPNTAAAQALLGCLRDANMSFDVRNGLEKATAVKLLSVEVVE